ncbi:MAG TPA: thioredoxin family protein [Pyrinomonadaceae bacterium]|nr:thioredoxin family protein [Pyrinomonadaceae bacterium]
MRRLAVCLFLVSMIAMAPGSLTTRRADGQSKYLPVTKYDPKRNADQDIRDAIEEAKRSKRRVLLEVGGEWCSWCHRLDAFFDAHPELTKLRDKHFVMVKINFSEENRNEAVLSRYGEIPGYPHIFVLDSDGTYVHSQNTSPLESEKSYSLERLTSFLSYWSWAPADTKS